MKICDYCSSKDAINYYDCDSRQTGTYCNDDCRDRDFGYEPESDDELDDRSPTDQPSPDTARLA